MTTSIAARNAPGVSPNATNLGGNFTLTVEPIIGNLGSITISQLSPLNLSIANPGDRLFKLIKVIPLEYRPIIPLVVGLAQFSIDPLTKERYFVTVQPSGDIEFGSTIIDYTASVFPNWFGNPGATNVTMLGDFNFVSGTFV